MSGSVGPHTAATQQDADRYETAADQHDGTVIAHHAAAERVADEVLDGGDPRFWALVYDACRRDMHWRTHWLLIDGGRWVQADDGSYVKAAA